MSAKASRDRQRTGYGCSVYVRRTGRAVLFDPQGDVLLLRSWCGGSISGLEWAWFLPGGGVEPGESPQDAAIREVAEETGIDLRDLPLTHLAFAEGHGTVGDAIGPMRDDIFSASIRSTALTPEKGVGQFRWWTLAELRKTKDAVFPRELAGTLDRYVSVAGWPQPVRLPW